MIANAQYTLIAWQHAKSPREHLSDHTVTKQHLSTTTTSENVKIYNGYKMRFVCIWVIVGGLCINVMYFV